MRRPTTSRCLFAAVALLVACSRGDGGAAGVADRFVDLYFIEIDQARALPLTTGSAQRRLQEEIAQVAGVRGAGHTADAAKPRVFYERTMFEEQTAAGTARAVYDIRIDQGAQEDRRHVLVSLTRRDPDGWKVAAFVLEEGPAARVP
jgi:hypothetical protein